MERVIIESPLSGNFAVNRRYALFCMQDSIRRGEAPFASHLLYPQLLDDEIPCHRARGMEAGSAWGEAATLVAVYCDLGRSRGMEAGILRARKRGTPIALRQLPAEALARFERGESPTPTRGFAGRGYW